MIEVFSRLGIALGLGLLVGLQRERTDARLAGFRTFPLVTLLGALCALLSDTFGGWVVAAGLAGLSVVIVAGSLPLLRGGDERPGVTSEVAMLLMFAVGAYLMVGSPPVAIATCGGIVVLLHLKPQLHSLAARIGDRDFTAIVQFALISLVILPVLPDRGFGPGHVLNPFRIWLMVVLIVGISLGGYVIYKFVGPRGGAWASGVLGGLISSTATAVSVARRSRQPPVEPGNAAFVLLISSAVVFVRVGILIAVTEPRFLGPAAGPLAAMFGVLALFGWFNLRDHGGAAWTQPDHGNPTELKPALLFGALYAVVLLAAAEAHRYFGPQGLYYTAGLSGLTDMDAITLSVTQLVSATQVGPGTGWRVIVVASMANLAFKAAVVAALGTPQLFRRVAAGFGGAAATGAALLLAGPG